MHRDDSISYKDAGVDIDAGDALIERIKPYAAATTRPGVMGGLGGFGALFNLQSLNYKKPVLVSTTDGVGTKLKLAIESGRHDTIGEDLVAMSVNDLIVQGAEPLFFLDYFATGRLDVGVAERVIKGIANGCEMAGCALVGGETAEMPGMYAEGDYDLAGFSVGVAEADRIIDGKNVKTGDVILGLASSGVHSNGYSLVRKLLAHTGTALDDPLAGDADQRTFADVLLMPTRIYVRALLDVIRHVPVHAMAHITGGGLPGNVPRVLPAGVDAQIRGDSWTRPAIFTWLQQAGKVTDAEMLRTFNCGIGMVLVVPEEHAPAAQNRLRDCGQTVFHIGEIVTAAGAEPQVRIV